MLVGRKMLQKALALWVSICMVCTLTPAIALADEGGGKTPDDYKNVNEYVTDQVSDPSYFEAEWTSDGTGHAALIGKAVTTIKAYVVDSTFTFKEQTKDINYETAQEAIDSLTADPLTAILDPGDIKNIDVKWTLQEMEFQRDGTLAPVAGSEPRVLAEGAYPTEPGIGTESEGSIVFTYPNATAGCIPLDQNNLQNNKIYAYTITVTELDEEGNPLPEGQEPENADSTIIVSTLDSYPFHKLFADDDTQKLISAEGSIFRRAIPPAAVMLSESDVPTNSVPYMDMARAAANKKDSEALASVKQLVFTNTEGLPQGYPCYLNELEVTLPLPDEYASGENQKSVGDTVNVYIYGSTVKTVDGVVDYLTDDAGNQVIVDGKAALVVKFAVSGTNTMLGIFGVGVPADGMFTVQSNVTTGGQVSPAGTNKFALGADPTFTIGAFVGYELKSVKVSVDFGAEADAETLTLSDGSPALTLGSLTLDIAKLGIKENSYVILNVEFEKVEDDSEYNVKVALQSAPDDNAEGNLSFISGLGEGAAQTVEMGNTSPTIPMAATGGISFTFNPAVGFVVDSVKVYSMDDFESLPSLSESQIEALECEDVAFTNTAALLSVIKGDIGVVVTYKAGLAVDYGTRNVTASIVSEEDELGQPVNMADIVDFNGDLVNTATFEVAYSNTATINVEVYNNYRLLKAEAKDAYSTLWTDVTADVATGGGTDSYQTNPVIENMLVRFQYENYATAINVTVGEGGNGTVSPTGLSYLKDYKPSDSSDKSWRQRITVKPASDSYVVGEINIGGTPVDVDSTLTERADGEYTFTVVKNSEHSIPNEGVYDDGTTDKVVRLNTSDKFVNIVITFKPKVAPAEEYVTVYTSVSATGGGSVTPDVSVLSGEDAEVTFFPDEGYKVKSVTLNSTVVYDCDSTSTPGISPINCTSATLNDTHTKLSFVGLTGDQNVEVEFSLGKQELPERFTITPTATAGGSISPATETQVYKGDDQTFTFLPNTGYAIKDVLVNGRSQIKDGLVPSSYTFTNVREDAAIHVEFEKSGTEAETMYNIEISSETVDTDGKTVLTTNPGGTVSPTGLLTLAAGSSQTVVIVPNQYYSIKEVIDAGDNKAVEEGAIIPGSNITDDKYVISNINSTHRVKVVFQSDPTQTEPPDMDKFIRLTPENSRVEGGATLSPDTNGLLFLKEADGSGYKSNAADDATWTAAILPGYKLKEIKVNGSAYNAANASNKYGYTELGDGGYSFLVKNTDITDSLLIEVSTDLDVPVVDDVKTVTITYEVEGNGQVLPSSDDKSITVEYGSPQTFYFKPDKGNELDSVLVNNKTVNVEDYSYTFSKVTANSHIKVKFVASDDPNHEPVPPSALRSVTVNLQGASHGWYSPTTTQVISGGSATITFMPDEGWAAKVVRGGETLLAGTKDSGGGALTFDNITEDIALTLSYEDLSEQVQTYETLVVDHADNGYATPEGTTVVATGASQTISVIPDSGYTVDKVMVYTGIGNATSKSGGVDKTPSRSGNLQVTLDNIVDYTLVYVTFRLVDPTAVPPETGGDDLVKWTLKAGVDGSGGSIQPATTTATDGAQVSFTLVPYEGHEVSSVTINGTEVDPSEYTDGFVAVTANSDKQIIAKFKKVETPVVSDYYTVTSSVAKWTATNPEASEGVISPSGPTAVSAGGSITYTVIPNPNYKIASVIATSATDGSQLDLEVNGYAYTLSNVQQDVNVVAKFTALDPGEEPPILPKTYNITSSASVGGSISPAGSTIVIDGNGMTYTFQANKGYKLSYVEVDAGTDDYAMLSGTSLATSQQYTFENVRADHTIQAVFVPVTDLDKEYFTVNVGIPSNGSITPHGSVLVEKGADASFVIAPYYGYSVKQILLNGKEALKAGNTIEFSYPCTWNGSTLTIKGLGEDVNLGAEFMKDEGPGGVEPPAPTYVPINVEINVAEQGAGGSASFGAGTTYIETLPEGGSLDITISPDDGSIAGSITVTYGPDNKVYNPSELNDIESIFKKGYIELPASVVNQGVNLKIDYRKLTASEKHRVDDPTDPFKPATQYEVVTTVSGGGAINPGGRVVVAKGSSMTFTLIPNNGYELSTFSVDGERKTLSASNSTRTWTFDNIRGNHTLSATFRFVDAKVDTFKVTTKSNGGGMVSPSSVDVTSGSYVTIFVFPDDNHKVQGLKVTTGGKVINNDRFNAPSYRLGPVTADTQVEINFVSGKPEWKVTPINVKASVSGGHGTVSPDSVTVPLGEDQTFFFAPEEGYAVDYVEFNGARQYLPIGTTSYTVTPVDLGSQDNTFVVAFRDSNEIRNDLNVNVNAEVRVDNNDAGSVSPSNKTVQYGGSATFYIFVNEPYTIQYVRANGADVTYTPIAYKDISIVKPVENGVVRDPYPYESSTEMQAASVQSLTNSKVAREDVPALVQSRADTSSVPYNMYFDTYMVRLENIINDVDLDVKFKKIDTNSYSWVSNGQPHKLTVTSYGGGTASPVGATYIPNGESLDIKLTPFESYFVESVIVTYASGTQRDFTDRIANGQVTLSTLNETATNANGGDPVYEDATVEVTFKYINSEDIRGVSARIASSVDEEGNPVPVKLGYDTSKDAPLEMVLNPDTGWICNAKGDVIEFPRNEPQYFFFNPAGDYANGPDKPTYVIASITYNGLPVPFMSGANFVNLVMRASGDFEIVWRPLADGEQQIMPGNMLRVTTKVRGGGGAILPEGVFYRQPGDSFPVEFRANKHYQIKAVYVNGTPVDSREYADSKYVMDNINSDTLIEVEFVEYTEVTVEWNNDHGWITPNTRKGEVLRIAKDSAHTFIVAPYVEYDVESVKVNQTEKKETLKQSSAAAVRLKQLTGMSVLEVKDKAGIGGFSKKAVEGEQASSSSAATSQQFTAQSFLNESEVVGLMPKQSKFARAYNMPFVAPKTDSTLIKVNFVKQETEDAKTKKYTINASVIGNTGGSVEPTKATVVKGRSQTFNFKPEAGYQVVAIRIDGKDLQQYTATSYTFSNVDANHTLEVAFDSIAHPGSNGALNRLIRTLQALAATGDLNGPIVIGLVVIAACGLGIAGFSMYRRRRAERRE